MYKIESRGGGPKIVLWDRPKLFAYKFSVIFFVFNVRHLIII